MALTKIDDRGLKPPIDLIDNEKIRLGTGNDLEIFHNGTNSIIHDTTSSNLNIKTSRLTVLNQADNEPMLKCQQDGAVELYYDNSKKFETTSSGATVTGTIIANTGGGNGTLGSHLDLGDNQKARFGGGDDLQIYHNGTNSVISETTGHLRLQTSTANKNIVFEHASNGDYYAIFIQDGACELYYDNSKKLETISTGINVTGGIRLGGNDPDNELQDYEEGSFSIGVTDSNNTFTTGQESARYIKIGRVVTCTFTINCSISGTSGYAFFITGLPFTVKNYGSHANEGLGLCKGTGVEIQLEAQQDNTTAKARNATSGSALTVNDIGCTNSNVKSLRGTIVYHTT